MRFRSFLEGRSGLSDQDFTGLGIADRMAQGRDVGEPFVRRMLKQKHGIDIFPAQDYDTDARLKIDGYLNGEAVQIKLRRSGRDGQNDIAYEVVRNHDNRRTIRDQLRNIHQQGRDYKGTKVKHYFVMNRQETAVYHVQAAALKKAVEIALDELEMYHGGVLQRPFLCATNGVELRPTIDRDRSSFTPHKVMAFIPVDSVGGKPLDITDATPDKVPEVPERLTTAGAHQPIQQAPAAQDKAPLPPYRPPAPRKILNLNAPRPKRTNGPT